MVFGRIVIHQADRHDQIGGIVRILPGEFDLLQDHASGITGADDQGAVIFFVFELARLDQVHHRVTERDTEDADHRHTQDRIQHHEFHRSRLIHQINKQKAGAQSEYDSQAAQGDIARFQIAPYLVIRAEHKQQKEAKHHTHTDNRNDTDRLQRDTQRITVRRDTIPPEQHITEQCRDRDQRRVGKHQEHFSDIYCLHNQTLFLI